MKLFPCAIALCAFLPGGLAGQQEPEARREVRIDRVHVLDRETRARIPDDAVDEVTIDTSTVVVESGESLAALLRERGIQPNAESYALVYDLNQEIEDVDEIEAGSTLVLPRASTSVPGMSDDAVLVRLEVNRRDKEALHEELEALPRVLAAAPPPQSNDAGMAARIAAAQRLEQVAARLEGISFENAALSASALNLLEDGAAAVETLLLQLTSPGDEAEVIAADEIANDIESVLECHSQNRDCLVPVRVNTYDAQTGAPLGNIQVYAIQNGKFVVADNCAANPNCGWPFAKINPIAEDQLVPGVNYRFWARNRAGQLISQTKPQKISYNGNNVVDLQITSAP